MINNDEIISLFEDNQSVNSKALVTAEWNLNNLDNILKIGNYRYRPLESSSIYKNLINYYDPSDVGYYYTNATDSDIIIDGGYNDNDTPQFFLTNKEKEKQQYSLEQCFSYFRPRSGINKARYFDNKYFHNHNSYVSSRPRYYMSDKKDIFKYWNSYRNEDNIERGIAKNINNGQNFIDDCAPFVIYKNNIPANRIVIKMQTNVGEVDLGPFDNIYESSKDPLYGYENQTTPVKWKVQKLVDNYWVDIISFDQNSLRLDQTNIIKSDGYVELVYGIKAPLAYKNNFRFVDYYLSTSQLQETALIGDAFLVSNKFNNEKGTLYVWNGTGYDSFVPEFGWSLLEKNVDFGSFCLDLVNPSYYNGDDNKPVYKEFEYISGLRIAVETMNKFDSSFDLIELSPRLNANITDSVTNYSITKVLSDLNSTGLPVGQLLASTGSIEIFDIDGSFNKQSNSIVKNYLDNTVKFDFYEQVETSNNNHYFIQIKTMYSENIPSANFKDGKVKIDIRDKYFYLESISAPNLFLINSPLSFVVSTLLDYVGISNYSFLKIENEDELIIPYFFCNDQKNVAQVLNELATSSQSAIFFNENNDLMLMSKGYILPKLNDRETNIVLRGSENNNLDKKNNIFDISTTESQVINSGQITYTNRYIQKTLGSLKQATLLDKDKNWIYKPTLLWEVAGKNKAKTVNDESSTSSGYSLSAIPLSSDLTDDLPQVTYTGEIINNIIDLGENVYWLGNYNGYFYSNGEVIRYDAVEYNIPGVGNVWIYNSEQYENYFSKLPFNGKMYPTGLVKIYTELDYVIKDNVKFLKDGVIQKHGRGQFGTSIVSHDAGLNSYWSNNSNVRGCKMYSEYLFSNKELDKTVVVGAAGINNSVAQKSLRTGIIKNFLSGSYNSQYTNKNSINNKSGSIQSSAFVFTGPEFTFEEQPTQHISYVYKKLDNKFKHFGTRLRIIGNIENNEIRGQSPYGSMTYFVAPGSNPSQNITVGGGSGGVGIMVNPETNGGYYFEAIALTETNVQNYASDSGIVNLIFYKVGKDSVSDNAVPVKMWSGLANILVDDGNFTGQYRLTGDQNPTVYDLAVEYMDIGSTRKFYLYLNNKIVAIVDDSSPLPLYNNMCLFIRGKSKLMFENVFALGHNYAKGTSEEIDIPFNKIFSNQEINSNDAFRKYSLSSIIQSTHLSGINPSESPAYNIYFDEFGSIMRECAYFNIKYDKAYPALYSKISPTFNQIKGYTVSGYFPDAYGAEFLIFNATDTILNLDETSGNYLRIQGVAFTQSNTQNLTVDDYYKENSSFIQNNYVNDEIIKSNTSYLDKYNEIKINRLKYGTKEFNLDLPFIQSKDDAASLIGWIIDKTLTPKRSLGVSVFPMPYLQLGDIVSVYYKKDGFDKIVEEDKRFVVYNIEYTRSANGPVMKLYCQELKND